MANFMNAVNNEIIDSENSVRTENGALAYKTTGKALVDFNFCVPQMRDMDLSVLNGKWDKTLAEDENLALRYLFFLRDIRAGLGERDTFRKILSHLCDTNPETVRKLVKGKTDTGEYLIPFFGRWDDFKVLFNSKAASEVFEVLKDQWDKDIAAMNNLEYNKMSLLAKWLPSINTSSRESRELARHLTRAWKIPERFYRQTLSKLRKALRVVERYMSAGEWGAINYEHVPSKANLLYSKAFMKHDQERRQAYIEALKKGEAKINSATTFPHDVVHKLAHDRSNADVYDAMWKALPNDVDPNARIMVVCDGSGSMTRAIPGGANISALEVSDALALYFAERLEGEFHNKFLTFSHAPQFVDISHCSTLLEKWWYIQQFDDCSNTNIEAVFNLILKTAIKNSMSQDDLPTALLFISDMEFDRGVDLTVNEENWGGNGSRSMDRLRETKLLDSISKKFDAAGYKLPRIIFWNVNSSTDAIPMIENELGIALISGYSTHLAKMVTSAKLDAYECVKEQLLAERYNCVQAAVEG